MNFTGTELITNETGPIYGVPLIEFLPMGETMRQAMPSRDDLEDCIAKDCDRVAAGYEVLLAHYHRVCEERDRLKEAHKLLTASVAHYCESEVKREPFKKR